MTKSTRAGGAIAAFCILAATACSSDGDDTTSASPPTAAATTAVEVGSDEATTTEATSPPATTEPEADEPPVSTSPTDVQLLDFEFQPVPAGQYRVETIGAPFLIDIPEGWAVQPNSLGHFVITDPASEGPGDRDIVMIRPSNLADPGQPAIRVGDQDGDWPVDDIDGWLDALIPGVVDGEPVDTTIGGLDAMQFDVAITNDVECGAEVSGYEATEVDISGGAAPGPNPLPTTLQWSELPDDGWVAPPDGTMWIMETPDGIAVITAEWFEPSGADPAQALAAEILDTIVIGG